MLMLVKVTPGDYDMIMILLGPALWVILLHYMPVSIKSLPFEASPCNNTEAVMPVYSIALHCNHASFRYLIFKI